MAATFAAVAGSLIFLAVWLLLLKDEYKLLPLGRALSAIGGAVLMVAFGVLHPDEAYLAVNLETLALLTGCMLVSGHMEKQGIYDALSKLLVADGGTPTAFLIKVSAASAIWSAVITNDASCIILTPLVVRACKQRKLHPAPHLMAVATCANIGSACSPIGNPQNMLVASLSKLTFLQFLGHIGIASLLGTAANVAIIYAVYKRELQPGAVYSFPAASSDKSASGHADADIERPRAGDSIPASASATLNAPSTAAHGCESTGLLGPGHSSGSSAAAGVDTREVLTTSWHTTAAASPASSTVSASSVTIAAAAAASVSIADVNSAIPVSESHKQAARQNPVFVDHKASNSLLYQALFEGPVRSRIIRILLLAFPCVLIGADSWIGLGWLTLLYAFALCVIDGQPPEPILAHVDGSLLLFFSGLFVAVAGFNATGVPEYVWSSLSEAASVRTASGTAVYSAITVVGSNIVSNVPLVLLMGPKVAALPPSDASLAWSLLAWVSTVAGNLTLLGSVANLIVAAKARGSYELTFAEYLRVGLPSTALMCALGVPLVWLLSDRIG